MKKTVAGILIALVACLALPRISSWRSIHLLYPIWKPISQSKSSRQLKEDSLLISIQRPGTWHDLFTPEDWTFVVQYADASNPHFYQLDIDKEEFVETSSSQKNLA